LFGVVIIDYGITGSGWKSWGPLLGAEPPALNSL